MARAQRLPVEEPPPRQVKQGESGLPSLALDLRYLITAYAPDHNDVEVHRLLGRALSVLHDHSVLGAAELAAALVHSDVHEQLERIRLILGENKPEPQEARTA